MHTVGWRREASEIGSNRCGGVLRTDGERAEGRLLVTGVRRVLTGPSQTDEEAANDPSAKSGH